MTTETAQQKREKILTQLKKEHTTAVNAYTDNKNPETTKALHLASYRLEEYLYHNRLPKALPKETKMERLNREHQDAADVYSKNPTEENKKKLEEASRKSETFFYSKKYQGE
jgi:heme oxygenase